MMGRRQLPSGPRGHFILGHIGAARADPMRLFTTCAREYGDVVPLRFGPRRALLLSHPDLIEEVLIKNSKNFIKSAEFRALGTLGGNGLFFSDGDFWLHQRRLMQPAFHRQRVHAYAETMVEYAERAVEGWK